MVMDPKQIEAIYRLTHAEKWSIRKIARHLHVSRDSVGKYRHSPVPPPVVRKQRASKVDPYKPIIRELVEQDPEASAVVIAQRLRPMGYTSDSGRPCWQARTGPQSRYLSSVVPATGT